ncbi:MAG: CDP-diacylglycerol--serine O-phosphatidyltransferase [Ignavibacteriaceae bacterium]|jgi:CDP-diacylglycerol--serine O-phosphatidyltransferase|nr:CDP-diacylglycerol--serine O-phosphatidyltransferase [Ignavibacteriaceae bacterium]
MTTKLNYRSYVANLVTALNVFCGFISIVLASEAHYFLAAIFIIAAAIFDSLDGIVARLLKTSSKFGVELDSLSDVVSFGAAPAFLIYKAHLYQFGHTGIFISSLILVFGAFRLARFNVQLENIETKGDFRGLPIPLSAITLAFFIISFYKNGMIIEPYNDFLIPLVIMFSLLMVSTLKYNSFPKLKNQSIKRKSLIAILLAISLIISFITRGEVLFYIFFAIILSGLIRSFYNILTNKSR